MMEMKSRLKLVIIGAGSAYTPEIFDEIIKRKQLGIGSIVLVDISEGLERARIICEFGRRMFRHAGAACDISLTLDRRAALEDADFVICQLRAGGENARIKDELIGMQHHILGQETTGAGGFMNAMRTIPVMLGIARDMEEICPQAWLINFTNPSGIVTQALSDCTSLHFAGLCNVPVNMWSDIAKAVGADAGDIHCTFAGLNHLSFVTEAMKNGVSILPEVLKGLAGNETLMKNIPKVAGVGELAQTIGMVPSPYLQYFYFEEQMLHKQLDEWKSLGKSRGVITQEINRSLFRKYQDETLETKPEELSQRGGSLYSFAALNIIEGLLSSQPQEMVLNVPNRGAISDMADDDVVEINCMVGKDGIRALPFGPLPAAVSGLVRTVKQYERLTVRAAVQRSRPLAVQALLNHPLIHGWHNAAAIVRSMEREFPEFIQLEG